LGYPLDAADINATQPALIDTWLNKNGIDWKEREEKRRERKGDGRGGNKKKMRF